MCSVWEGNGHEIISTFQQVQEGHVLKFRPKTQTFEEIEKKAHMTSKFMNENYGFYYL